MTMIEAAGLTKKFGAVTALRGLDLAVARGRVCALLGPNGAGKTTAIRILATLTRPDAGQAVIAGHDAARQPRLVRASIGLVGQHAAVDDDLTGQENLVILGLMHHLGRRAARQRAAELLAGFDLAEAGGRLVRTWSGGMRRRLDLLASLVVPPPVLILDEPTTGLDPRSRADIWSAVRELARAGTTVLVCTQYLAEADEIADEVVIIDGGRAVAQGSPDALKDTIGARVVVILADAADRAAAAAVLAAWATGPPGDDPDDQRRLSAPVAAGAVSLPELVRALDAAGLRAEDVSVRRPTLDEVFLDRTGGPRPAQAAS
jgi:ABC-2 type transport system ATP-binding protein